jgi:CRISPR-associated protein Cmr4
MGQAAALLVLRAHTGIHAGVGQEVGTVDLPIQRERVTNFPVVRGSSLKGALRQAAQEACVADDVRGWLFGPETTNADEYGGALSVGDARLLLFPMRSLRGTFSWLSCPFVVQRLKRDLTDSGLTRKCNIGTVPVISDQRAAACTDTRVLYEARQQGQGQQSRITRMLVVEDYGLEENTAHRGDMDGLATAFKALYLDETELKQRLALVGDDLFQNFVSFATEIVTRVHLDDETKTVKRGQLWTEELLPAESVLAALVVCADQRQKVNGAGKKTEGKKLLQKLVDKVKGRFQIGGNETVGYGVCHAAWLGPVELSATATNPTTQGRR